MLSENSLHVNLHLTELICLCSELIAGMMKAKQFLKLLNIAVHIFRTSTLKAGFAVTMPSD